jgi:hypothetical protein
MFRMNLQHLIKTGKLVKDAFRMRNLPVSSSSSELLHLLEELWTTQICVCCASEEIRIPPEHEIRHTTCTDNVPCWLNFVLPQRKECCNSKLGHTCGVSTGKPSNILDLLPKL